MGDWSRLPPEEIERRRHQSIAAIEELGRQEWERRYQETCDKLYWAIGKCCAGCDHWSSSGAMSGNCLAAGIVSGEDVLRSMGVSFSSYMPPPGPPYTKAGDYCGKFSDAFDWSTLDEAYLRRIGAWRYGTLREKPTAVATRSRGEGRE